MKQLIGILGFSVLAALPVGAHAQGLSCEAVSYEQVIEKQNRINRYFHGSVVPKMMNCWETLSGKGTVSVAFNFSRDGDKWRSGDSKLLAATLLKGQNEIALHCLQEAVRDTSFAAAKADGESKELLVNWSFPVPWPRVTRRSWVWLSTRAVGAAAVAAKVRRQAVGTAPFPSASRAAA